MVFQDPSQRAWSLLQTRGSDVETGQGIVPFIEETVPNLFIVHP